MCQPQEAGSSSSQPAEKPSSKDAQSSTDMKDEDNDQDQDQGPSNSPPPIDSENTDERSLLFSTEDISAPHTKADLAQEILALRKSLQEKKQSPGKVKQLVTDLAQKEEDTADDDVDLINTIMSKLSSSTGEDGEGDPPSKEDLLNIYLGFAAEREVELNVKIEGEFNVTVLYV
ncbi:hypothetical protein FE257_012051 [Aspergillus nanangensis]|uniref:Uncharacterized protein n=1 Tax=Aspergillus nanangensis TaxID=2582783 RepID=A0AAD4CGK3_ASPNN|nr:hypothetical protein FE257_012051 [Aspergillus nanangensis]